MTVSDILREHALYGDLAEGLQGVRVQNVLGRYRNPCEWYEDLTNSQWGMFCLFVAEALENP